MDRASHACAVVALRMLGGGYGKRVAIVCGKGNNGGDGVACARHLASAGVSVSVFLLADLAGDAAAHLEMTRTLSPSGRVRIAAWAPEPFARAAAHADLVVDAIFGTGFSGAPRGDAAAAIEAIARMPAPRARDRHRVRRVRCGRLGPRRRGAGRRHASRSRP